MVKEEIIRYFENDRYAKITGLHIVSADPGSSEIEMDVTENHLNANGVVQGGALYTLADFAFAVASNVKTPGTVSLGGNIQYFKPARGSRIMAKASEISSGRKVSGYVVDMFDESGELVARFNGTGYVTNPKQ